MTDPYHTPAKLAFYERKRGLLLHSWVGTATGSTCRLCGIYISAGAPIPKATERACIRSPRAITLPKPST